MRGMGVMSKLLICREMLLVLIVMIRPYAKYGSYQYKGYGSEVDKEGEGTQMMKENE